MKTKANGELKIEKGIPLPAKSLGGGRGFQKILKEMKAGDSVVLPTSGYANAWSAAANALGSGNFMVRREADKGFRVWRMK